MKPRSRPSDLLDTSAAREPVFMAWCVAVIETWRESGPHGVEREFISLVHYFDWAFEVSERLIRSAEKK
jgi:hypothetical protein